MMYYFGHGIPKDYKEAVKWFLKAAEQGHAAAQFGLGTMYYFGHGVPEDYKEAVKWHRLAAEQGHFGAQHDLGMMYAFGKGVPKDYVQAHLWYNLAASQENKSAIKQRDILAKHMTPAQIAKAQELASNWKPTKP